MRTSVKKLDFYKPTFEIFSQCHEQFQAVFLDSSLKNHIGRYSIIGVHPYLVFQQKEGKTYRNKELLPISFEQVLQEYLKENAEENHTDLPLISGAVGYFSYDYGRKFEDISSRHQQQVFIPEAYVIFYDNYIIEDCVEQVIYLTGKGELKDPRKSIADLERWIKNIINVEREVDKEAKKQAKFNSNFEAEEYKKAIDQLIRYIIEGDVYIANMTQQLQIKSPKAPYEVFRYLRRNNPAPFGGYLNYGDFQIICASPERFLKLKDRRIETRPIKGTRKRGATVAEDDALRNELQNSAKDRSELLMIVDLLRNDLNRVCIPGSVQVTEHFKIEEYATVFHLVTTIIGEMAARYDVINLIQAAFPGGSITGAPKIRAMEIIDELEGSSRGLYTGSLGYIGLDGSCDLNIVIRTAIYKGGVYHLGVGGGITCESQRELEYEETLQKAKAVLEAISDGED